jgi:hypothetical protein
LTANPITARRSLALPIFKKEAEITETIMEINDLRGFDRLTSGSSLSGKKSFVIFGSWLAGGCEFSRGFFFIFFQSNPVQSSPIHPNPVQFPASGPAG